MSDLKRLSSESNSLVFLFLKGLGDRSYQFCLWHFSVLQAMYRLVLNSYFTTFVRSFSRVNHLQTNAKQLPVHSPRNSRPYAKYGTLVFATGAAGVGVYYSQLTNHEKRIVRVTLSGMGRFARFVLFLVATLIHSSWNTWHSHSVTFLKMIRVWLSWSVKQNQNSSHSFVALCHGSGNHWSLSGETLIWSQACPC